MSLSLCYCRRRPSCHCRCCAIVSRSLLLPYYWVTPAAMPSCRGRHAIASPLLPCHCDVVAATAVSECARAVELRAALLRRVNARCGAAGGGRWKRDGAATATQPERGRDRARRYWASFSREAMWQGVPSLSAFAATALTATAQSPKGKRRKHKNDTPL